MIRKNAFVVAVLAVVVASVNPAFADRHSYGKDRHTTNVNVDVRRRGGGAGTFIAGAIVGGAISSAARPTTVVVVPPPVYVVPPMGGMVPYLPGGCQQIIGGGVVYQRCGGVFYQPFYQGGGLSYRVVAPF
jgi:hypothetical protein